MRLLKNEILEKVLLRRTKVQQADVLALPPRYTLLALLPPCPLLLFCLCYFAPVVQRADVLALPPAWLTFSFDAIVWSSMSRRLYIVFLFV